MFRAAYFGHTNVVTMLVEVGADVMKANNDGVTTLHWAALNDRMDVIEVLLAAGADPKAVDSGGRTALDMAVRGGEDGAARRLRL